MKKPLVLLSSLHFICCCFLLLGGQLLVVNPAQAEVRAGAFWLLTLLEGQMGEVH